METDRYLAWLAQRAGGDEFRLSMALLGLFVVVIWESMRLWPEKWQNRGRLAFIYLGGGIYAVLIALAVWTLVRAFAGYR